MEKKLNIFVLFLSLLLLYPGILAEEQKSNNELLQSRDHDTGSSSYQVPPQQSSSGYGGYAPAKPAEMTTLQKFKFGAVIFILCIMTLGIVWVLFRVSYYAELGAAGTTRSAVLSFWNGMSQSIFQDFMLTDLASNILNPQTMQGILDTIHESSK